MAVFALTMDIHNAIFSFTGYSVSAEIKTVTVKTTKNN